MQTCAWLTPGRRMPSHYARCSICTPSKSLAALLWRSALPRIGRPLLHHLLLELTHHLVVRVLIDRSRGRRASLLWRPVVRGRRDTAWAWRCRWLEAVLRRCRVLSHLSFAQDLLLSFAFILFGGNRLVSCKNPLKNTRVCVQPVAQPVAQLV